MIVCLCKGVSDRRVESLVDAGLGSSVEEVGTRCGAGTDCGSCREVVRRIVECRSAGQAGADPEAAVALACA